MQDQLGISEGGANADIDDGVSSGESEKEDMSESFLLLDDKNFKPISLQKAKKI